MNVGANIAIYDQRSTVDGVSVSPPKGEVLGQGDQLAHQEDDHVRLDHENIERDEADDHKAEADGDGIGHGAGLAGWAGNGKICPRSKRIWLMRGSPNLCANPKTVHCLR